MSVEIHLMRMPKRMPVEGMQGRFAWKRNDCADALRHLAKKNGIGVAMREDERRRVARRADLGGRVPDDGHLAFMFGA